jgi:hypothetical protein
VNSKLHRVSDGRGRPLTFVLSPGQRSDAHRPLAKRLLGDKGWNADRRRDDLQSRGLRLRLPARGRRKRPASPTRRLPRTRGRIENAFARPKDWNRSARRTPRCGDLVLSALALAAAVIFWLPL